MAYRRNMTLEEAHNARRDRLNRERVVGERDDESQGPNERSEDSPRSSSDSDESNQSRRRHKRDKVDDTKDIKINPPDFIGSSNPEEFFEWVQCPNQRALTAEEIESLPDVDNEEGEPVYDDDESEKTYVGVDIGEMLVVRRVMHANEVITNAAQRENIFHCRCTVVKGKVCDLNIDGGSYANAASTYMVEKLELPTVKHPHPYKLQWLSEGSEVKVNRQVSIPFSIGSVYEDKVVCDVVPMHACHILLGRPWKKVTLTSLKRNELLKINGNQPSKSLFMSQTEVEEELTGGSPIMMLLVLECTGEKELTGVPSLLKSLLKEFTDVFPEDLPEGLPPVRGIEHQIDLVPGSVLQNKAAYRCSPTEAKELQRQVDELVAKGYVRASMSPWLVPALLVPKKVGLMRMCVDSRAINNITIKYRYPIPRLDDMFDELHGSSVFSKIDLKSGYHQIRMKDGDEWKTAFKIKGGLYEWLVMHFGLSNAPSTFMRLMNEVLKPLIESVIFLGYVMSKEGISMDPSKVEAIRSWPVPTTLTEFINGQHKLNARHTNWVEFLQSYSFVSKHKVGVANVVADALSRRYSLLSILEARVLGFSFIKELYAADPNFSDRLTEAHQKGPFIVQDGFLFKNGKLCIPRGSIRDLLIWEAHGGGLAGHFGINKTGEILTEHF
uniref:uncharacterized protein LOC122604347 n=1 Tax=Erigeron canadensis TaxID=72917 RepID=UPI001CB8F102|nr:uncharacterized protein LOC122604347 [Erigeron canadensis]